MFTFLRLSVPRWCVPKQRSSTTLPGYTLKSFSCSKSVTVVDYCEKSIAMELIQDRRTCISYLTYFIYFSGPKVVHGSGPNP